MFFELGLFFLMSFLVGLFFVYKILEELGLFGVMFDFDIFWLEIFFIVGLELELLDVFVFLNVVLLLVVRLKLKLLLKLLIFDFVLERLLGFKRLYILCWYIR